MKLLAALLLAVSATAAGFAARTFWYEIDTTRSQITFLAKSRIAKAHGLFRKWDFKGKINGNFHVVGDLQIECASIDTDNERRDNHLKNADFFDCERFPRHTFRILSAKGDSTNQAKITRFEVTGELTIRGITQPVTLTLVREGDDSRMVLTGSTLIDRDSFGLTYNSALNPIEKQIRIEVKLSLVRKGDKLQ